MNTWYTFLLLLLLLALAAFFAGAEVALVSVSRVQIKSLLKQKRKGARALKRLKENPTRMIIAILIGNNVVNVAASAVVTVMATELFGSAAIGIAAGLLTLFLLVFGEILPKTYAQNNARQFSLLAARPILALSYLFLPLIVALEWVAKMTSSSKKPALTEGEIRAMVEFGVEAKVLEPEEQQIINRAMRFSDTIVTQIMTPLQDVTFLSADAEVEEAVQLLLDRGFSRAPVVFGHDPQHIVGIAVISQLTAVVHAGGGKTMLRDVMEKPLFISATCGIDDAMKQLTDLRLHLGIVRDKKKRILGVITLEDIIEELVGEIEDEQRHKKKKIK